jgi:hypothetical protein
VPVESLALPTSRLTHAERGRLGAQRRWGETPRVVRLDELSPEGRRLVLALVDAAKKAAPLANGTAQESRRDSVDDPQPRV